jgi:hypothetical protein
MLFTVFILNKLLGWDYIQWENSCSQGVARVWIDGLDRACYWQYKNIRAANVIHKPEQVIWLTCEPRKYMKKEFNG